jgi:hypothetical protein
MKSIVLTAALICAMNLSAAPGAPSKGSPPEDDAAPTSTGEASPNLKPQSAAPTTISGTFTPASFKGPEEAIFDLVVRSPHLAGTTIVLNAPAGFKLDPQSFNVPVGFVESEYRNLVKVSPTGDEPGRGRLLTIQLKKTGAPPTAPPLGSGEVPFEYAPLLGVRRYLLVGLLGIILGYMARAATKLLSSSKPPDHEVARFKLQEQRTAALAANAPPAATPSAAHVAVFRYWYALDFMVTVLLGGLVLVATMKDGLPPITASYWHAALTAGFALGLLTNSELLTKVKV